MNTHLTGRSRGMRRNKHLGDRGTLPALLSTFLLAVLAFSLIQPGHARAQSGSAADLINAVNALRSANGLEPYGVDGGLMSEAQAQSEYQASIQACTHTRADGSGPADHGISAENVACGPDLSVQGAINGQWSDSTHSATMLGPDTGLVGAGVATGNGGTYYTLAVRRLTGEFVARAPQASGGESGSSNISAALALQDPTEQPPVGNIAVSTPNADGSISHVVQYGETLIQIAEAYHIPLRDLISMNSLDPLKPVYFAGQVLLIRPAFTLTPFMTATFTPRPPTRTPAPTRTPRATRTAAPLSTAQPSRTPTSEPLVKLPTLEDLGPARPVLAYAFIGISALGLVVLVLTSFLPGKKE